MKVSELLSKAEMKPVAKGRNVKQVGCVDGYFLVRFHTGALWCLRPERSRDQVRNRYCG